MVERSRLELLPLCILSAVVLALEVLQSRLVAYSVANMMIYAVIGIALLGFGVAGSLVALRQEWLSPARLPYALAWSAQAFCVSIVIAHALFVRLTPLLLRVDLAAFCIALLLGLPFLAAGTVVTLALSAGRRVGEAYAANLIGSGLGCFLPLVLLGPLDGSQLLGFLAVLAWFGALPYLWVLERRAGRGLWLSGIGTLALALGSLVFAQSVFPVQPDPAPLGQLQGQYEYAAQHGIGVQKRFDRWNPTGRIEVIQFDHVPGGPEPYHAMFYAQDSSAGSTLFHWDGRSKSQSAPSDDVTGGVVARMCSETLYGQGYFAPRPHVLVIGLGGGPDLQCALYHEARRVDVVEINQDSIAAIRGPLNEWVGGIGSDPRVHFHERDGRSFVHDVSARFDLIQLSGVDTKNNLTSGAFALSENTLYTLEAFRDYLRSLSPDGALSFIRFGEPEALRLAQTALFALRELGVQQPARHIAIGQNGIAYGVIVRRKPWTEAEAEAFRVQMHPADFRGFDVYYYTKNGLRFDQPAEMVYLPPALQANIFTWFVTTWSANRLEEIRKLYPFDISPTVDDRPFFFDIWRYDQLTTWQTYHVTTIRNLLLSIIALSLACVLWPLRKLRSQNRNARNRPLYFACLGLGFVLVEVWLLHHFTTFLGHQAYSLSVVLATLLVSSGIGAALGGKLLPAPRGRAAVGCLGAVVWVIGLAWASPAILDAAWSAGLPARAALTIALVAPLGLLLGQPFVAGLTWLRASNASAVPWCIGINGFCSVVASVGVIPLLMAAGYLGSLSAGVALYTAAALLSNGMRGAD